MNIYDWLNKADAWFESSSLDPEVPTTFGRGMIIKAGYIAILVFLFLIISIIKGNWRKKKKIEPPCNHEWTIRTLPGYCKKCGMEYMDYWKENR